MDILEKLKWRYAVKEFDSNKKVPQETVKRLLEAVNLSATSMGLQQFRIMVIEDQEMKNRLFELSGTQKQINTASHILVFACLNNLDDEYIEKYTDKMAFERSLPENVAADLKLRFKNMVGSIPKDQKAIWEEKQAYLGLGNLLTVAAIEGVDTCPMEGFSREKYDEILGLKDKQLRAVVICPIGYRSENDRFQHLKKVRLPLEDFMVN